MAVRRPGGLESSDELEMFSPALLSLLELLELLLFLRPRLFRLEDLRRLSFLEWLFLPEIWCSDWKLQASHRG